MTPDAYLIRERYRNVAGDPIEPGTILCGKIFKTRYTADDAATRLSNNWRVCTVEPVFTMATIEAEAAERALEASSYEGAAG